MTPSPQVPFGRNRAETSSRRRPGLGSLGRDSLGFLAARALVEAAIGPSGRSQREGSGRNPVPLALLAVMILGSCSGGASSTTSDVGIDDFVDGGGDEPQDTTKTFAIQYGMNSSVNGWAERAIPFSDAMARASEFIVVLGEMLTFTDAPLIALGGVPPLLGEGWPDLSAMRSGERAGARLFTDMGGSMPDGRTTPYVVVWSGSGSCSLTGLPVLRERNRSTNRVEVFVDPTVVGGNATLAWIVYESDPTDPVRDVHVWLPGMEANQPLFWPPYLEKLRAMNAGLGPHTWRTLNWNRIRHYGDTEGPKTFVFDLPGRIRPGSPSQGTRRGVCPEYQVALCNELGANLHFNVPHQADPISDDDYEAFIREALLVIRDGSPALPGVNNGRAFSGLDPGLTVTIEYSNEIWNPGFPVHGWMQERADENGLTFEQQVASEIQRVFSIADSVFGDSDRARLQKYVAGSLADPTFLQDVLLSASPGLHVDAVGCAGYFKPSSEDEVRWNAGADSSTGSCPNCPTPPEVVSAARANIQDLRDRLRSHAVIAGSWSNPDGSHPAFDLYEAGQSFIAGYQLWADAATDAQVLPEMYAAYVDDLVPMFIEEGVRLVNWYSFMTNNSLQGGAAGPFGHWDNMTQVITLPVPEPYLDEGVPKATAVCKGPPVAGSQ